MLLLPAIDLMGGQVVRLRQGLAAEKTIYSDDPVAIARQWEKEGGDWLHIVDLDGAFGGESRNLAAVRQIVSAVSIPCELGGGMRSEAAIQRAVDSGISRVVIGTRACESIDFVGKMAAKFGGEKIAVGIDARDGIVAVKGWTESGKIAASDLAIASQRAGVGTLIYTDIATDGMLAGPNIPSLEKLMALVACNVIASGGVSCAADVEALRKVPGLYGCIIGKALYDQKIGLAEIASASPRKTEIKPRG